MLVTRVPNADSQPARCGVPWIIGNHERPARAQSTCATRPARSSPCCTARVRCPTGPWCAGPSRCTAGPRSGPGRTACTSAGSGSRCGPFASPGRSACTRGGPGSGSSTRRATCACSRPGRSSCTGSGRSGSASSYGIA